MERIVSWADLCSVIEPRYPKSGNGRPPVGLQRVLRMYFVQFWFNLSDQSFAEALHDRPALRCFVDITPGRERVPDATALLKFRRRTEVDDSVVGDVWSNDGGAAFTLVGGRLKGLTPVEQEIPAPASSTRFFDINMPSVAIDSGCARTAPRARLTQHATGTATPF